MNKRIKKYLEEIEKTERKITEMQMYLKGIQSALKQEENSEMIKAIRGMKLSNRELFDFLTGIENGTIHYSEDSGFIFEKMPESRTKEDADSGESQEVQDEKKTDS